MSSLFRTPAPPAVERTALVVSVGLLTLAAWAALWLSDGHHHHLEHSGAMLLFVGGWAVMTVAMMLPTSLPILTTFHAIAGARPDRVTLVALVIAGYLVTWTVFGALVYLGNLGVQWVASSVPWRGGAPWLLLVAGAFQFTKLKYRCLDKCRSPFSFVVERWQGVRYRWQAFRLGVDHGIFCVGCCWALMLLMFAVGVGNLGWMFLLGVVMAVEKNVSWGRRIGYPLGVLLVGWGAALLVFG